MMGRLHIDMVAQRKYHIESVNIHLKLNQSPHSFNLMGPAAADFVVRLHNILLFARKVKISPSVNLLHAKALAIGLAKYVSRHVKMKTYTNPPNRNTWVQKTPFLAHSPAI